MTAAPAASTVNGVSVRRAIGLRARMSPFRFDLGLAVTLFVAAELEIWLTAAASGQRIVEAALASAMAACVAIRRLYPVAAGLASQTLIVATLAFWGGSQVIAIAVAWLCALYGLAVWSSERGFAVGIAYIVATDLATALGKGSLAGSVPFAVATPIVMVLVRRIVGDRERRAALAERERDLAAREAVVEERARIARELHDAIAHNVSMMVVQAGAERRVLAGEDGAQTREVLSTIERIGREALTEMRRLVGMLRYDEVEPLVPQPGLDNLPTLVAQVREAGLPVELRIDGDPRELPVGLELSAYRIVQEALTNALKHARDAHATVHVHYGSHTLELQIDDDGAAQPAAGAGGHGLVGMRERVALYGGRFDAGRRSSGGFGVHVLLPIR